MDKSACAGPDLGAGLDIADVPQCHWLSGCFKGVPVAGGYACAHTEGSIAGRDFTVLYTGKGRDQAFVTCKRDISALQVEALWDHDLC
jgi:hypothetical protein